MKKLISGAFISIVLLSVNTTFAAIPLPNSEGKLYDAQQGGPESVKISLNGFNPNYLYDVYCTVQDPNGEQYPSFVRIDTTGVYATSPTFDGQTLITSQAELKDNHEHIIKYSTIRLYGRSSDAYLTLSRLGGDGIADPIIYRCAGSFSSGLAK